jgi:hypothetical protein
VQPQPQRFDGSGEEDNMPPTLSSAWLLEALARRGITAPSTSRAAADVVLVAEERAPVFAASENNQLACPTVSVELRGITAPSTSRAAADVVLVAEEPSEKQPSLQPSVTTPYG